MDGCEEAPSLPLQCRKRSLILHSSDLRRMQLSFVPWCGMSCALLSAPRFIPVYRVWFFGMRNLNKLYISK